MSTLDADTRIFADESEVKKFYEQDKEKNEVVLFEGVVYNVADYKVDHPGGPEYLERHFGENIEEPFEEAEHTKSARKQFQKLPVVGKMRSKVEAEGGNKASGETAVKTGSVQADSSKPLVTITGISGYVGSQVCLHFLKDGGYRVRGTVRSTKNAKKMDPLKTAFREHFKALELVEADLLDE